MKSEKIKEVRSNFILVLNEKDAPEVVEEDLKMPISMLEMMQAPGTLKDSYTASKEQLPIGIKNSKHVMISNPRDAVDTGVYEIFDRFSAESFEEGAETATLHMIDNEQLVNDFDFSDFVSSGAFHDVTFWNIIDIQLSNENTIRLLIIESTDDDGMQRTRMYTLINKHNGEELFWVEVYSVCNSLNDTHKVNSRFCSILGKFIRHPKDIFLGGHDSSSAAPKLYCTIGLE